MTFQLYIPHLDPVSTGQAACLVLKSPSPLGLRLYQNAALPFLGQSDILMAVNTVPPPCSTSLIC